VLETTHLCDFMRERPGNITRARGRAWDSEQDKSAVKLRVSGAPGQRAFICGGSLLPATDCPLPYAILSQPSGGHAPKLLRRIDESMAASLRYGQ